MLVFSQAGPSTSCLKMPVAATQLASLLHCLGAYTAGRFREGATWRTWVIKCFLFFCWHPARSLLIKSKVQIASIRKLGLTRLI